MTGELVPARIEVTDEAGESFVADEAMPVVVECFLAPQPEWASPLYRSRSIDNPHAGTEQFYLDAPGRVAVPPGRYRVRAHRGNEYEVAEATVEVEAGARVPVELALRRWIHPAALGWHGADDHIHISRYTPEQNDWIARWMRAEGLEVANLLQMGTAAQFGVTPQYAFGDAGAHRQADTLLLAGQEHPRSHLLGHTITLGAERPVDLRDRYVLYEDFWKAGEAAGGVSGFAHWGLGPAELGLAITAPNGRVRFVEVLQFEFGHYDILYQLLDMGIRVAPTAGTDFPCIPSVPGRERFYARIEGEPSRAGLVEAVRRGRTFVTNGPFVELDVEGHDVGDELVLTAPRDVRVTGHVHFDPARDDVQDVELVLGGEVVPAVVSPTGSGGLRLDATVPIDGAAWLALRVSGEKIGEAPLEPMMVGPEWVARVAKRIVDGASLDKREAFARAVDVRPTAAHTAPVYVTVAGAPGLAERARARAWAGDWVDRLDSLAARLDEERIADIDIWDWFPYSDGVSEALVRRHRDALLAAIASSRSRFAAIAEGPSMAARAASETP